jgi:hypothetical protein
MISRNQVAIGISAQASASTSKSLIYSEMQVTSKSLSVEDHNADLTDKETVEFVDSEYKKKVKDEIRNSKEKKH